MLWWRGACQLWRIGIWNLTRLFNAHQAIQCSPGYSMLTRLFNAHQAIQCSSGYSMLIFSIAQCHSVICSYCNHSVRAGPARSVWCIDRMVFRRSRVRSLVRSTIFCRDLVINSTAILSQPLIQVGLAKYVHSVPVNCSGSLPPNSVDRLTDRYDLT